MNKYVKNDKKKKKEKQDTKLNAKHLHGRWHLIT